MKEKRSKKETKWKFGTKNRFTIRLFKKCVKWEVKPRQCTQSISLVFFNPNACSGEFLRSKQRANRKKNQKKKNENTLIFFFHSPFHSPNFGCFAARGSLWIILWAGVRRTDDNECTEFRTKFRSLSAESWYGWIVQKCFVCVQECKQTKTQIGHE